MKKQYTLEMSSLIEQTTPTYEVLATLANGSADPLVAIVRLNHAYDVEQNRFLPRMTGDGRPMDYQQMGCDSPVNNVSAEGSIGKIIKEEIDKLFKEQTADWCT